MIRKLVILGSSLTALAVARDASAHGLSAVVLDGDPAGLAFRSRHATPVLLAPGDDALAAVFAQGGAGVAVVATADHWLARLLPVWSRLEQTFEQVFHPRPEAVATCLSKARFALWCRQHALDAPLAWLVGDEPRPAELRVPVLLRPVETLHARPDVGLPKAVQARTEEELASWLREFDAKRVRVLATESLLDQRLTQYSVPFARAGKEMMSFVARKIRPLPERCAVGTCVELAPCEPVEALGRRAAEQLDYVGIGEAEVLHSHDTGRNYLIEINVRPWLQYPLAPRSGHDFLGLMLGRRVAGGPPVRKEGLVWVDLRSDLYTSFSREHGAVRTGGQGIGEYLRSMLRANVFARFALDDPVPAFDALHRMRPRVARPQGAAR